MPEVIYFPSGWEAPVEEGTVVVKVHNNFNSFKKRSSKPFFQDRVECHIDVLDGLIQKYMNSSWNKVYVIGKSEALAKQ